MNSTELERLIHRYLDGIASAEEMAALSAEIETSEAARELYLRLASIHAALAVRADESVVMPVVAAAPADTAAAAKVPVRPWRLVWPWSAVAAALIGLAVILLEPASRSSKQPNAFPPLGRVTAAVRLQPEPTAPLLQPGRSIRAGRFGVSAGAVEIVLTNEVRLVFEGPGELELFSATRVFLHSGQIVVRVPEGVSSFELETPAVSIVDLGTEFAVKAGADLSTDVQVYEGAVLTTPAKGGVTGRFPQQLIAGEALRFNPAKGFEPERLVYVPERFVRRLLLDNPIEHDRGEAPLFNALSFDEVVIPRVKSTVAIDGDLSEWSGEGLFRAQRAGEDGTKYFVEGRMRYDAEFLYIAAHIGDPAPLRNVVDPDTDGELGWRGGGLQVRLSTDRSLGWPVNANAPVYYRFRGLAPDPQQLTHATSPHLAHLTLWHHAPSARDCLHIAYGMDFHGSVVNPPGYRGAARLDPDARGYTLEYAIPWKLLHAQEPPRAGDVLAISWTVHWSDQTGRLWRGNHVELRNSVEPIRIHTWERAATWGRALYQ
jgi:hypothetical protein